MSSEANGPSRGRSTGLRKTSRVGRTARPVRRVVDAEGARESDLIQPVVDTVIIDDSDRPVLFGVVQGLVEDAMRQAAAEPEFEFTDETPDVAVLEAHAAALGTDEPVVEPAEEHAAEPADAAEQLSASTSITFDRHVPIDENTPAPAVAPADPQPAQPRAASGRRGARSAERPRVPEAGPETAMQVRDRRASEAAQAESGLETSAFMMNVERAIELTNLAFNYVEVGTTRGLGTIAELPSTLPEYYIPSRQTVVLGRGDQVFKRAAERLLRFKFIRDSGVQFATTGPRAARDVIVEQRTNVFGVTVITPYRIIAVDESPTRVSFLMGTLTTHPEHGEERYSVYLNGDGDVVFEIFSFTATQSFVSKLGKGVARSVQSRMAARYLEAAPEALTA